MRSQWERPSCIRSITATSRWREAQQPFVEPGGVRCLSSVVFLCATVDAGKPAWYCLIILIARACSYTASVYRIFAGRIVNSNAPPHDACSTPQLALGRYPAHKTAQTRWEACKPTLDVFGVDSSCLFLSITGSNQMLLQTARS